MQDPFYHKQKRPKKTRMLDADAWLDSSMYEFWQSIGRGYTRVEDFFARFRVSGVRRFFVEITSDALSFAAIGAVLMTALAIPSFDATAFGQFNKAEDISVIFLDRFGSEIGRRGIRTDDSYALDRLPDHLIKATLATEDRRFYDHFGIDVIGTLRALMSNAQGDSSLQGGSSITQQLAKNLFLTSERTIERKIKEAFLALWLETHYTKDEILKLYLDRAYMGGGNFGVAAAAEFYFGKQVTDLTLSESAMLAGLYKAPTRFAPHVDIAAARGRANLVLSNLVDAGFLTEGQVSAARRAPASPVDRSSGGSSPDYFLDWAFEEVRKIIADSGSTSNSFIVRSTVDPTLQTYAEDAVISTVREQGAQYNVQQAAMVVLDTKGAVRAMVGGVDYGKSQFNRAIVSNRQPGSAFKPFVYSTAFEMLPDYSPRTTISDRPVCIGNWCPQNYGRNYKGSVTLDSAFAQSINTVPVNLSIRTGRDPIAETAHRMGITNDFPVTRSLALGVASVSVLDMAQSYAVFANDGLKTPAFGITRVTTLRGDLVYEADENIEQDRVLSEQTVSYMNSMMRSVVTSGTGRRAHVEGVPAIGKTGTTSSYRDAWFCGLTGNYVAVVWFGNDDYTTTKNLTGGTLPAMTWQKFMAYAHTNIDIKPIMGVDFQPVRQIVAATEADADAAEALAERPPVLTPAAADKLLDVAERLDATLGAARPEAEVARVTEVPAPIASESL